MSSIANQLQSVLDNFKQHAPEAVKEPITRSRAEIVASFDKSKVLSPGSKLPDFKLNDASGKPVTRDELLAKGALLLTFYRGNWCPFCNIALHGLQQHLAEFAAKGVTLVAVSPELPDNSLTTKEKNDLEFEVLSDEGNKFARELGIVWRMPEYLKPAFGELGTDLAKRHGNHEFEVPVPANFLVDKEGVVRNVFVDSDYTKRLEPATAVEWANAL
ncbi:hypothetical protein AK830_g9045 [Neonectria ditissima]|uniref:thioredoxin-dependent peroxiredoxin n=1 Tax=Neonectria ditissima TaxID=78410 RepID=A0A0P7B9U6_9HYPO|nr:hypothetical protein AK830_g9045 [Neonectria ditissima]